MKLNFRPRLLLPSTRAFIREARRTPGYSISDWFHGYIYARWPYLYIGIGTGEHRLGKILAPIGNALLRLFICSCCACCCGAMQLHRNGVPMLAPSGYLCRVNADLCEGCGGCIASCQFGALSVCGDFAVVNQDHCMGCGVCISRCNRRALSIEHNPCKGEPLEILELLSLGGQ